MFVCIFFLRGHQHSNSVLRNSSNYLTFAGINNTCAFSGFVLIKPFWSAARPKPAPGEAGRRHGGHTGWEIRRPEEGWTGGRHETGDGRWQSHQAGELLKRKTDSSSLWSALDCENEVQWRIAALGVGCASDCCSFGGLSARQAWV